MSADALAEVINRSRSRGLDRLVMLALADSNVAGRIDMSRLRMWTNEHAVKIERSLLRLEAAGELALSHDKLTYRLTLQQ